MISSLQYSLGVYSIILLRLARQSFLCSFLLKPQYQSPINSLILIRISSAIFTGIFSQYFYNIFHNIFHNIFRQPFLSSSFCSSHNINHPSSVSSTHGYFPMFSQCWQCWNHEPCSHSSDMNEKGLRYESRYFQKIIFTKQSESYTSRFPPQICIANYNLIWIGILLICIWKYSVLCPL